MKSKQKQTPTEIIDNQRQAVVEKIIEDMKRDGLRWAEPYLPSLTPHNPVSGTVYQGGNRVHLGFIGFMRGYTDNRWATFNQIKDAGWHVKKGAKSALIEKWKQFAFYKENEDTGEKELAGRYPKLVGNETNALKAFACLKADDRARFVVWLFLLVPYLLTVLIRQHLASIVIVKTFNWLSCFYLARYETTRYTDSVGCILHAIELFSSFKANNRFSFSHSVRPLSNETVFLVFIFLSRDFSLLQELLPITPCANA